MHAITEFVDRMSDRSLIASFNARRADPEMHWKAERQYALQIIQSNDMLQQCSPNSVAAAMATVASLGLSLAPERRHAYLIPRRMKQGQPPQCLATPSYMGLQYLARQSGEIANIYAELVCEHDPVFQNGVDEHGPYVKHEVARKDRGEVTHAYCITFYANGTRHIEVMSRADLDQVERAAAAAQNGSTPPSWKFYPNEMRKKVVIRRASKHWPISSSRLSRAIEAMDKAEPVELTPSKSGLLLSDKQLESIKALAKSLGMDPEVTVSNFEAAYGVDSLNDLLSSEAKNIKRAIRARAKGAKQ